jgi:diguanylate cyclase (GGDEF)-like protein
VPQFTKERPFWLLICRQGCWDVLMRGPNAARPADELESVSERALALAASAHAADAIRLDGLVCFSMMVGGHPAGMILVSETEVLTPEDCRAIEAAAALSAISIRNVQTLIETRDHSVRDALTGCFNRAHALETLSAELGRARRSSSPLSMIMFDVDRFKEVNDTHGHLTGDRVLAEVGRRLADILRTSDVKCRYGGDEFLLILPDTPSAGARQLAESIRQEIASIVVSAGNDCVKVSASLGVVTAAGEERTANGFIGRADEALYAAKHAGRNRVHIGAADATSVLRLVSHTA